MIEFYAYVLVKRQLYVQFSEYGCGCILKEKPEYDCESLITKAYIKIGYIFSEQISIRPEK